MTTFPRHSDATITIQTTPISCGPDTPPLGDEMIGIELQEHRPAVVATRRGDWRRNPYPGPFNDSPHHPHLSRRSPPSAHENHVSQHLSSHRRAPLGRISPLLRNNHNTDDTPTQPHFLGWVRDLFFRTRSRRYVDEGIELQERHTEVVDIPFARRRQRNYSRGEVERKREEASKAKTAKATENREARDASNAKNSKSASAGSSRSSQNNVTQQPGGATFLDADATGSPNQDADGLPFGFFDDSESLPHPHPSPSRKRRLLPFTAHLYHAAGSIPAHGRALLGHVSSLSRRTYSSLQNIQPQPRHPEWPRNPFSGLSRSRNDEPNEPQEHRPVAVDVSCAHANLRHYSKRALLIKREREREKKKKGEAKEANKKVRDAKAASEGSPEPYQRSVTAQSGGAAQVAQPISEMHVAGVSTSSAAATTSTTTRLDVITIQDGRWNRFRIFICCVPAHFPDGYH
ncbi:hypothetical protein M405DRAFT_823556 [Rhizopogon salebrosus TDB-379]|nr:hypothetical protein M405DRAFT_823556 [Rhizopogon salebrosus TDB-379]